MMEFAIGAYMMVMVAIGYFARHGAVVTGDSKIDFYLAGRGVPMFRNAMSIAATWTWGIALFISAKLAFAHGWVGLFWFTVPNALALMAFGYAVDQARIRYPNGITMSDYMTQTHSRRVGWLYFVQIAVVSACAYAVQLIFGGMVLSEFTSLSYGTATVAMAAVTLIYSLRSGLNASIATDFWQYAVVLAVLAVFTPWVIGNAGTASLAAGAAPSMDLFSYKALVTMAVPMSVVLIAGTFGNHENYQRAYASDRPPFSVFMVAAVLFATVPIMMGLLAMVASGSGITLDNPLMANVEAIKAYLPGWAMIPFALVVMSGLISTLDSALCSFSSLAGHDLNRRGMNPVRKGRIGMMLCASVGLAVANAPFIDIFYLWLLYGTYRAVGLAPVVSTMMGWKCSERGAFYGIIAGIIVGLPLFAWARLGGPDWAMAASALVAVIIPFVAIRYVGQEEAV